MILGKGEFGVVFKGTVEKGGTLEEVAIKTTKSSNNAQYIRNLLSELKVMIYIGEHPNIVRLVGANTDDIRNGSWDNSSMSCLIQTPLYLSLYLIANLYIVSELCSKGCLESFLRQKSYFDTCDRQYDDSCNLYVSTK